MKKGIVFTMDVLIGLSLLIIIASTLAFWEFESILPEKKYQRVNYLTDDVMDMLSYLEVKDIQDKPTIKKLIEDGTLKDIDLDKCVLDLIASFWYADNKTIAENITREVLEGLTNDVCLNLTIDSQTIYSSCNTSAEDVAVSTRIETGYETGRPSYGYIARAFLTSIRSKKDSSYAYFGGYVGDGNITRIVNIPSFNSILEVYMEFDMGDDFDLYINGDPAGSYTKQSGGNMTADKWVVCNETFNPSYCSYFDEGDNIISINFTGNLSFIGGGYLEVTYNTTQLAIEKDEGTDRYWFPGIHGFINLYSSFYVPGTLTSMKAYLHYFNDLKIGNYGIPVYVTIGNKTIFRSNNTGIQTIELNYTDISNVFGSETNLINTVSNKTVPIRFGVETFFLSGKGVSDAVLVTDISGSMGNAGSCDVYTDTGPCDCDSPPPCNRKRINVAKEVDENFTKGILELPGNRIGLVSYSSSLSSTHSLSDDESSLISEIQGYTADGATCISCGINSAIELLKYAPISEKIISAKSLWLYNTSFPTDEPPLDITGKSWKEIDYDDSNWDNGSAILGFEDLSYTYEPNVDTDIVDNSGNYYFRKNFTVDVDLINYANIYVLSDDRAEVYLNGYLIDNDTSGDYIYETTVFFSDDFDDGFNSTKWTVTQGSLGSEINTAGTCGYNTNPNALIERWDSAAIESMNINLSDISSPQVSYWIKQGDDVGGCENPESGEDLTVEYLNSSLDWVTIKTHPGGGSDPAEGTGDLYNFDLASDASHENFKIRFSYSGGDGSDWDYWAVDDIRIEKTIIEKTSRHNATYWNIPGIVFSDDFDDGFNSTKWTVTQGSQGSEVVFSSICGYNSSPNALIERWDSAAIESMDVDLSDMSLSEISYRVKQGDDVGGCENPESGEDLTVEYLNSSLDWVTIKTHPGGGSDPAEGSWRKYDFELLSDALHENFKIRFNYNGGDGSDYDYWAIDDFIIKASKKINTSYFMEGENVIAVKLYNSDSDSAKFDFELVVNMNASRKKATLVMSDGFANYCIPGYDCNDDDAKKEAINKACEARDDYNITVYSVAFGESADNETLKKVACWNCSCDPGTTPGDPDWNNPNCWIEGNSHSDCSRFYESSDADELDEIYRKIAEEIAGLGYEAQIINITGSVSMDNILYEDSYIEYNFTPIVYEQDYGEISLTRAADRLREFTGEDLITDNDTGTKQGWYNISDEIKVVDAKMTSYSSEYWTDRLLINSSKTGDWIVVYNLSDYDDNYQILGDPYIIQIPADLISPGNNSIKIGTGIKPANATGASPDDRLIYTMRIKGSVDYGDAFNSSNLAIQDAENRLIEKISNYVDISEDDIDIETIPIKGIQWLWGPSLMKIIVWEK